VTAHEIFVVKMQFSFTIDVLFQLPYMCCGVQGIAKKTSKFEDKKINKLRRKTSQCWGGCSILTLV
jgi:hypothetical protein